MQVHRTDLMIDLSPLLEIAGPQAKEHLKGPLPQMLVFGVLLDLADRRDEEFSINEVFDHLYGFVTRTLELEWPPVVIGDEEDYALTLDATYRLLRNAIIEVMSENVKLLPASLLFVLIDHAVPRVGIRLDYVKKGKL